MTNRAASTQYSRILEEYIDSLARLEKCVAVSESLGQPCRKTCENDFITVAFKQQTAVFEGVWPKVATEPEKVGVPAQDKVWTYIETCRKKHKGKKHKGKKNNSQRRIHQYARVNIVTGQWEPTAWRWLVKARLVHRASVFRLLQSGIAHSRYGWYGFVSELHQCLWNGDEGPVSGMVAPCRVVA